MNEGGGGLNPYFLPPARAEPSLFFFGITQGSTATTLAAFCGEATICAAGVVEAAAVVMLLGVGTSTSARVSSERGEGVTALECLNSPD